MKNFLKICHLIIGFFLLNNPILHAARNGDTISEEPASSSCPIQASYTQEQINTRVANTALRIYSLINQNWISAPDGIHEMTVSAPNWEAGWIDSIALINGKETPYPIPGLIYTGDLDLLPAALDELVTQSAVVECTIAQKIVRIFCLRDILGDPLFVRFSKAFQAAMIQQQWALDTFCLELSMQMVQWKEGEKAIPGSFTYIPNAEIYSRIKPNTLAIGMNVTCVGEEGDTTLYVAFNPMYKDGPLPEQALLELHRDAFLSSNHVKYRHGLHTKLSNLFLSTPELFNQQWHKAQDAGKFHQIFDAQSINDFLQTGTFTL